MNDELRCASCKQPIDPGYYGTGTAVIGNDELCLNCARFQARRIIATDGHCFSLSLTKHDDGSYGLWLSYLNLEIPVAAENMRQLKSGLTRFWFKFDGAIWTGITKYKPHPTRKLPHLTSICMVERTNRKSLPDVGKKE
jgi:hypothetical protein